MTDNDIDIWFNIIDQYMRSGDWRGLDNLLEKIGNMNDERLFGKDFLLTICTATLPAKSKLIARDKIYQTGCRLYGSSLFSGLG